MAAERREGIGSISPDPIPGPSALELTRTQLARDLHDSVGQSLNTLLVRIRLAIAQGEASMDELKLIELMAQQALAGARSVAYGLREPRKTNPIAEARDYARQTLSDAGCLLAWVDERTNARLDSAVLQGVALAIKESTTNIARHARAKVASIELDDRNGGIRVTIVDDGVGFTPATVRITPDGRGLGLAGNAERLAALGGSFSVQSAPGAGTTVVLEAPYDGVIAKMGFNVRVDRSDLLPEPSVAAAG